VVVIVTVAALLIATVYVSLTPPVYRATAVLASGYGASATGTVPPAEFLDAQRSVIESAEVLAAGVRAAPQVPDLVQGGRPGKALRIKTSTGDGTIELSVEGPDARQASDAANAIANAYVEARGGSHALAAKGLSGLTAARDARAAERDAAERALADFRTSAGAAAGEAATQAADARIEQLAATLKAASAEVESARAAAGAARSIPPDDARLAELVEAHRATGIFAGLDQQRNAIADELRREEANFERQRQTMLPQHPTIVATQKRIEQLKADRDALAARYLKAYQDHVDSLHASAQKKAAEIQTLLAQQQAAVKDQGEQTRRLGELQAALRQADAALAEADARLRDAMLSADAVVAQVTIAQPAVAPRRPVRPDRVKALLVALGCGIFTGVVLVAVGAAIVR
jgi:uncharacterized protein involved in exopolysaccharide biosynthesis